MVSAPSTNLHGPRKADDRIGAKRRSSDAPALVRGTWRHLVLTSSALLALGQAKAASCSWDQPGHRPYGGDVAAAVDDYSEIPEAARERLKRRMRSHRYDDVAVIRRDTIEGHHAYFPDLIDMHFADGRICAGVTRTGWRHDHTEIGLVYCEGTECVIVPTVCRNVSRVRRRPPMAGTPPSSTSRDSRPPLVPLSEAQPPADIGPLPDSASLPVTPLTSTASGVFPPVSRLSYEWPSYGRPPEELPWEPLPVVVLPVLAPALVPGSVPVLPRVSTPPLLVPPPVPEPPPVTLLMLGVVYLAIALRRVRRVRLGRGTRLPGIHPCGSVLPDDVN
jgi:hypothetical protein